MKLLACGLSYKTTPVSVREKISFSSPTDVGRFLSVLLEKESILECVAFSTCNRTEIYSYTTDSAEALRDIMALVSEWFGVTIDSLREHWYSHRDQEALQHLFKVASSLDAMVVGEAQILGQLKEAYDTAVSNHAVGSAMHRTFHRAFQFSKKVRHETNIARRPVSVSAIAVELAKKIFDDFNDKTVVVVGLGKMSRLTIKYLQDRGLSHLLVVNRNQEKAAEFARANGGETMAFNQLNLALERADIVVTSTAASQPVITVGLMQNVMKRRKGRPIFMIDIAVPRDIEEQVTQIENVYSYNIDDLKSLAASNMDERQEEAEKATKLVENEASSFYEELKNVAINPTLAQLSQKVEAIRQQEVEKAIARLNGSQAEVKQTFERCTKAIVSKILHDPIVHLKEGVTDDEGGILDYFRRLFRLG